MTRFEAITGKFIVLMILVLSLFSFIVISQDNNNVADPIMNNTVFNQSFGSLTSSIESTTSDAQEKYLAFNSEEPKPGFGSIVLFGIVSVGKTFSESIFAFFGAVVRLPLVILGIPDTVYGLTITWLIIGVIVGAWLLYKFGGG